MRRRSPTVAGLLTKLVITPKRLGTFPVICTELCGLGHAVMRSWSTVQPRADFLKWVRRRGGGSSTGSGAPGVTSGTVRRR